MYKKKELVKFEHCTQKKLLSITRVENKHIILSVLSKYRNKNKRKNRMRKNILNKYLTRESV